MLVRAAGRREEREEVLWSCSPSVENDCSSRNPAAGGAWVAGSSLQGQRCSGGLPATGRSGGCAARRRGAPEVDASLRGRSTAANRTAATVMPSGGGLVSAHGRRFGGQLTMGRGSLDSSHRRASPRGVNFIPRRPDAVNRSGGRRWARC